MRRWRITTWLKTGALPILVATAVSATVLLVPVATETAVANGDTRTIHLLHAHTHESIDATFMVDGQYDPAVLEKLNWFLRDFRRDEAIHMDPKLFDTIWEVYRESGSHQPIVVMSAYRSPETNAMLRRASRAVAEHSQHILGKAMDQHYMDVPMSRIREIAMRLQRGGVGFYPTAGTPFVHMDVGGVRHWPRMSYDQLARLFPDGKTVHIPSNGQPLPGYEVARAELEARGDSFNYPTAGEVQSKSKGFFAWLFGGGGDEGDEAEGAGTRGTSASRRAVASIDQRPSVVAADATSAIMSNRNDAGIHSFALNEAQAAAPAAAPVAQPAAVPAKGRRGKTQVASLQPAEPPSADAQQKLADEMQRQQAAAEAQRQAAAAAQAQAVADAQRQAASDAQRQAAAAQARADAEARAGVAPSTTTFDPTGNAPLPLPAATAVAKVEAPLPPRRPVELASAGPAMPMPPARPDAIASDRAPVLRPSVVASLAPLPPSARADLPTAITRGTTTPPPRALGFVAAPAAVDVPLPVARPQLVAARLDRSNFRSLTGNGFGSGPGRGGLGSAMSGLRPAARANLGTIATAPSAGTTRGFGQRATDLTTDRFSGTAVDPSERISTAVLRRPRAETAPD